MSDFKEVVKALDLDCKQSLVDLLFHVQGGTCSCRRAASEIIEVYEKSMREAGCIVCENCSKWAAEYRTDIEGIELCVECWDGLIEEDNDERNRNTDTP